MAHEEVGTLMAKAKRSFGYIRQLPSKRYRATYTGPDGRKHNALHTFDTIMDAEAWLVDERRLVTGGKWLPPGYRAAAEAAGRPPTLTEYATGWLESRDLKPRSKALYGRLLAKLILPHLGELQLTDVTPTAVRSWYTLLGPGTPTLRAHSYALLRTVMGTAVSEQLIPSNPCVIRGGSSSKTVHRPIPATLEELEKIVEAMPERLRLSVLIAAWCGLRQGEIFELRRGDIDLTARVIRISRAVVRVPGEPPIVGTPKNDAGSRTVSIPPHLIPAFEAHLGQFVPIGKASLLFRGRDSGQQLPPSTLYRWFYPAREAAGRPDLRWHDLRHTGATMAAATGATLAELMNRIGHSTVGAAMKYQHASSDRDQVIAELLSQMVQPTPLHRTAHALHQGSSQ